jgi:hypothetical protein
MTIDFVDYESVDYQTWLLTLAPEDRSLMNEMSLEQLGTLNSAQLERRAYLRSQYLKEKSRMLRVAQSAEKQKTKEKAAIEEGKIITKVVIEDSRDFTKTLVLTEDKLYMEGTKHNKEGDAIGTAGILARPPILKKIIRIDNKELLVVSYGEIAAVGNIEDIIKVINRTGGVMSRHYKTGISTILEAQRRSVESEIAYPCVGIFVNPDTHSLTLAATQFHNIYATELKENGEADRISAEIAKRTLPEGAQLRSALTGYISLDKFMKPLEIVPVIGYAAAIPFTFELKGMERQDYFCQVLLHGPADTGKSTSANLATDDLYGVLPKGIDYIDSKFKMLEILNATTLPQHIAEMETFDFDEFADTIKNGTDIRNVGSRGNADQTQNSFYGKSTLFYSANSYKASKTALLARIMMIPAQHTKEEILAIAHLFNAFIKNRTKSYPLGYSLLVRTITEYPDIESIAKAVNRIRSEITYNTLRPEISIKLTDNRRSLSYALMLFGVRSWQKYIHSIFPKLASSEYSELWFNKYASIELFIEDIIRPLEGISAQVLEQNPTSVFIAWLESFISNQGEKEEGYTWMHARKGGDYIYVTKGVLETYKKHCKQSGGAPFESLPQLATELTAYTGERVKETVYDIGRDEERDPQTDRIIKQAVPYKGRKAIRVPMGQQMKLAAIIQAE